MGEVYAASSPAAANPCANGPTGWDQYWTFPGPPWPGGWPIAQPTGTPPGGFTNVVTIPANNTLNASIAVTATIQNNGADSATLQCHNIVITATLNGVACNVSTDNATWAAQLQKQITNYSGSHYGISQAIYVQGATNGQTVQVECCVNSVSPALCGFASGIMGTGVNVVAGIRDGLEKIATSPDGVAWTNQAPNFGFLSVCWSPSLSLFCGVFDASAYTSPDGITWTRSTTIPTPAGVWGGVCWSPDKSLFVAVSGNDLPGGATVMTSPDGVTWTARSTPADGITSFIAIAWSPSLGLFCAPNNLDTGNVLTSPDGVVWTLSAMGVPSYAWRSISWSPSLALFVAVGDNAAALATSANGQSWTLRSPGEANRLYSVCFAGSLATPLFCAVSPTGTHRVQVSADGITWTPKTAASADNWEFVTWSTALTLFIAVSISGKIMTSPDGTTWTGQTCTTTGVGYFVASKG